MFTQECSGLGLQNGQQSDGIHRLLLLDVFLATELPLIRFRGQFIEPTLGLGLNLSNAAGHRGRETLGERVENTVQRNGGKVLMTLL